MTTFFWAVDALDCAPLEGTNNNVVKTVHWRCGGLGDGYHGVVYSTCSLPSPKGDFIAYADLAEATVLGWIWANGVDKDATEAAVQSQIDKQVNPPIVQPPLPWAV